MNALDCTRGMSWRMFDPVDTLARLRPIFAEIGLTRINNQTGLDRLGVPVVSVCRPNAKSNAVCQGKGLTLDAAKISGVMESIETYCAENILLPLRYASQRQLTGQQMADLERLSRVAGSGLTSDTRLFWIEGRDLASQDVCLVPFELVHADFTVPYLSGTGHFLLSTTGLASGNSYDEAVLHATCEVIERDAMTLANLDLQGLKKLRVALDTIDNAAARHLLSNLFDRDMLVAVWNITTDITVAAFKCQMLDRDAATMTANLLAEGYGCHPNRSVALLRAITEAAQSRLTAVAGSRDDLSPAVYGPLDDSAIMQGWRRYLSEEKGTCDYLQVPNSELASTAEELSEVQTKLSKVGFCQVVVVDISAFPRNICSVVRVIVPGLEGPMHPNFVPGKRARQMFGKVP